MAAGAPTLLEIPTTTMPMLPSFLLILLLVNNYYHHVVVSSFSPSASMSSTMRGDGDIGLLRRAMGRPATSSTTMSSRSILPASSFSSTESYDSMRNIANDRNDMKSLGEKLIMEAALQCGATEPMICIEWKADRIIVTVDVTKDDNYVHDDDYDIIEDDFIDGYDDEDDDNILFEEGGEIMYDDEVDFDIDDDVDDNTNDPRDKFDDADDDYESYTESESDNNRIDLSRIARTINEILAQDGEDSLSFTIAKLHEIEVTTPEFDNVLRGKRMFESYKGFDVTVEYWDEEKKMKVKKIKSKSQKDTSSSDDEDDNDEDGDGQKGDITEKLKLKIVEGKLVGRDYEKEVTLVNIKGRVATIRNDMIERVCLPKAKREKGVK
jgi:hypothetical protein